MATELKVVTSWGELTGEFVQNQHGFFCTEIAGLRWPYEEGVQPAYRTPEEAAEALLAHYIEEQ